AVMMVGKKDAAVLGALPGPRALGEFTLDHPEDCEALPPDIGPSVAWIMQYGTNKRLRWHLPHEPGALSVTLVDRQFQALALDPTKGLGDTALVTKDPKPLVNGLFHPVIGVFDHLSTGVADVPSREQANQFTPPGFRLRPLVHPLMQYFEFRHTHR